MSGSGSIRLRLMLRGTDMPQWRNKRKYAAESDVRRMYLRGRQGTLKVDALPLEQALLIARAGPKERPPEPRPMGTRTGVVAVTASEVKPAKPAAKREKRPWSVGHSNSGSVLRPKPQPKRSVKKSTITDATPAVPMNATPNLSARERRRLRRVGLDSLTPDQRSRLQLAYHGSNLSAPPRRSTTPPSAGSNPKGRTKGAASAKPKRSSARFDGQPKWESGRRIVQGGLPESGRR